ncbi:DNA repair protein [Polychaeton citri CBS 116435]|uniref:DNA repair protein REV1 n=1 Tax=Polychaeton citri CBS 116435 TaxID=1314669 RepID=A0A9P4Q9Z7_9PEZI|nr:DNA repair protein [Polychaeton citri CBS 116435]
MGSRLEQKSDLVRKRIESHSFENEEGEEYEGSKFGGFPEYFRRKKIKLQNLDYQLRQNSNRPQIFRGIVCHVNGYTQPSLNDLHKMIVERGGGFMQYLDGKTMVTHIVASNLTPKKKEEFRKYRIVKPAWVVDSCAAGRLLPWNAYRIVDEGVGQKVIGFRENGGMVSRLNEKSQGYKTESDGSWYTSQLKASTSQSPPPDQVSGAARSGSTTQIVTPQKEIEDDEFPLPDITSSIENALDPMPLDARSQVLPPSLPQIGSSQPQDSIATPPPSSPALEPVNSTKIQAPENTESHVPPHEQPTLRPRVGSQEPDHSHAVIRDSKILKAVSPSRLASMTAEEHNALLLSDPNIRKSTVVHPDFLDQYYRESRLHHLSTWKADLKSQMQALAIEKINSQKAKSKKLPGQRRYIMHVDFDSFFATVSLKNHPHLAGKPCVVAHGGGSGSEIASCNYPARRYGISNGMWMRRAQDLCPDIQILPYDFPAYEAASRTFYDVILATGGIVQSVSIDEALVDISACCFKASGTDGVRRYEGAVDREQSRATEIAQELRDEVKERTGCAVSVGLGGNILLAKVALRKAKPAGQYQLKPEDVLEFIGALEVSKLPGVAWSIGNRLEEIGIKLVKDIRETSKEKLVNTLGPKTGEKLWEYSRGIDRAEVGDHVVRKSVSAEVNWGVRFENQEQVDEFMHGLCGELQKRLSKEGVRGKLLTIKIMIRAKDAPLDPPKHLGHGRCDTYNKSVQLGVATNDKDVIAKEAIMTMRSFRFSPGELRGIGVQMQKLDSPKPGLDGAVAEGSQRRLQFKSGPSKPVPRPVLAKQTSDPIQDDSHSTELQSLIAERPSTDVANVGTQLKTRLNTSGTQFMLPSQVDPEVLAELPDSIRAKFSKQTGHIPSNEDAVVESKEHDCPKHPGRVGEDRFTMPNESQLDPQALAALPNDVRAEVLGYYKSPSKRTRGEQALLPQSPRKNRTLLPTRNVAKRKRGGGLFAGLSRKGKNGGESSTLTQANFVSRAETPGTTDTEAEPEQLDAAFLAALPEDIRREVLEEQRQRHLQRAGGIDTSLHQRRKPNRRKTTEASGPIDRHLMLSPQPVRPTFTTKKLSSLPDLRNAVKLWVREFSDEGPYDEDVAVLIKYLQDVVVEEKDMGKAVQVIQWFEWVIDDASGGLFASDAIQKAWRLALERAGVGVQQAAEGRGIRHLGLVL